MNGVKPENPEGESVKKPGLFSHCKAIGWMVDEYDRAQISINLTDYNVTSMHHVLEATRKLAAERGLVVTGSEIVGLVPFPALLETGKFYLRQQGRSTGIPVIDILNTAVQSLGLNDVSVFNLQERVLGLPSFNKKDLVEMKLNDFADEVSRESPAPGGGSIAALAGALGASLASMVSNLTANKRGSEQVDDILVKCADECQDIKFKLIKAVDDDTNAFNQYMDAKRLSNKTEEEIQIRKDAMQHGLKTAVMVPLLTAELSLEVIKICNTVATHGNPNSITDIGVGASSANTGVIGGVYNVLINLKGIDDKKFVDEMKIRCEDLRKNAEEQFQKVQKIVESKL